MWAGVTVSVLSVQLRFQAQTQLRQTYGDRAQNTHNADHAVIADPVERDFNKMLCSHNYTRHVMIVHKIPKPQIQWKDFNKILFYKSHFFFFD
jgi:hypothetical protein